MTTIKHPAVLYPVYPEDDCVRVPRDFSRCGEVGCHIKFAGDGSGDWVYVMHPHHEDWEVLKISREAVEDLQVNLATGYAEWSKRLHDEYEARAMANIEDQVE